MVCSHLQHCTAIYDLCCGTAAAFHMLLPCGIDLYAVQTALKARQKLPQLHVRTLKYERAFPWLTDLIIITVPAEM